MAEPKVIVAPKCTSADGLHDLVMLTKPEQRCWWCHCRVCGMRYAMVAEAVLDQLDVEPQVLIQGSPEVS